MALRGVREVFYESANNALDVQCLSYDPATPSEVAVSHPVDLSQVTRVTVTLGGVTVDSAVSPSAFQWLGQNATGKITVQLGGHNIPVGEHYARLVTYDPLNIGGVVWSDQASSTPWIIRCEP